MYAYVAKWIVETTRKYKMAVSVITKLSNEQIYAEL